MSRGMVEKAAPTMPGTRVDSQSWPKVSMWASWGLAGRYRTGTDLPSQGMYLPAMLEATVMDSPLGAVKRKEG